MAAISGMRRYVAVPDLPKVYSRRYCLHSCADNHQCGQVVLQENRPLGKDAPPSLFALTAQSNVTNAKNPLSLIQQAQSLGYATLLDAAALAPTSIFSLSENPVDAMAVSFYKMFGFPTGVGALIARESFLARLERPWFAGGTVDVVQAPGPIVTLTSVMHERFEVSVQ